MHHYKSTLENTREHDYKLLPTLLKLTPYLKDFKVRIALSLLCLVFAKLSTIAVPLTLKPIYDQLGGAVDELIAVPITLLIVMGLLRFGSSLFNELRNVIFITASLPAVKNINSHFFNHLCQLPLNYHVDRKTGGLSRDMERGSMAIRNLFYNVTVTILPTLFELTAVLIILIVKYPFKYAGLMMISILAYALFTYFVARWRIKFRAQVNAADSKANAIAIDALLNYETVKYFNNERYEQARYETRLTNWIKSFYKSESSLSLLNTGQALIIAMSLSLMMIFAAKDVQAGTLTIGDFALINGFLLQVFIPLNVLGFVFKSIQTAVVDVNQMMDLLDLEIENKESENKPFHIDKGAVSFQQVSFSYQQERAIIKDINFDINGGEKVAFVGASGAGKSTIARLLFRFYQPNHGTITIDNQDINQVDINQLRQHIAVVPQDVVLFNDSLAYNISYGNPNASKEAIEHAAKLAYLNSFISSLPDGYDTMVGERGLKLSGGEKQRVAIARAILKDPKILILDEATSSLDSTSEAAIQKAIASLTQSRTSFIIAHRLSTIQDADKIFVVDDGCIVESGKHQELLNKQGHYANLWQTQRKQEKELPINT